jgi:hypothetical protein
MILVKSDWKEFDSFPAACSAQVKINTFTKMPVLESASDHFESIDAQDVDATHTTVLDVEASSADPLITILSAVTEVNNIPVTDVSADRVLSDTHVVLSTSEVDDIAAAEVTINQAVSGTYTVVSASGKTLQTSVPALQVSSESIGMTAFVPADIHISLNSDHDFDRDNPIVVGCTAKSLLTSNPFKLATAFLPSLVSPPADSSKKTLIWDHHMPSMSTSTGDTLNTHVPACHFRSDFLPSSAPFLHAEIYANLIYDPDFDRYNPDVDTSATPHEFPGSSPIVAAFPLLSFASGHLAMLVAPPILTPLVDFNDNCILCCPSGSKPYNQGVYTATTATLIAIFVAFPLVSPTVQVNLPSTLLHRVYTTTSIAFQFPSMADQGFLHSQSDDYKQN